MRCLLLATRRPSSGYARLLLAAGGPSLACDPSLASPHRPHSPPSSLEKDEASRRARSRRAPNQGGGRSRMASVRRACEAAVWATLRLRARLLFRRALSTSRLLAARSPVACGSGGRLASAAMAARWMRMGGPASSPHHVLVGLHAQRRSGRPCGTASPPPPRLGGLFPATDRLAKRRVRERGGMDKRGRERVLTWHVDRRGPCGSHTDSAAM